MENYPGNSHKKAQDETQSRPKVEQIVQGEVLEQKKSLGRRFADTFTGTDARSVFEFIVMEVLVPAAKDMIFDAASQGVERALFGDSSRSRRSGGSSTGSYVSYNRYSSSPVVTRREGPERSRISRQSSDYNDIILESRFEANDVLDKLYELLREFDFIPVADLYDLLGKSTQYTDQNWGWTSLKGSDVVKVRQGYLLKLPKPEPLN